MVAGVLCAVGALMLAKKYISSMSQPTEVPTTRIIVAREDIEFGTRLSLGDGDEPGNVGLAKWLAEFVPEGAIESVEAFNQTPLIAGVAFVKHQPILTSLATWEDDFVPDGWFQGGITVGKEDAALVAPGDRVDIFRVTGSNDLLLLIRCARVYAIGSPRPKRGADPGNAPPASGTANRIYVLLPDNMRTALIEANLRYRLMVLPVTRECGEAVLVDREPSPEELAQEDFQKAVRLMDDGQYKEARTLFLKLAWEHASLSVGRDARPKAQQCLVALTGRALAEAREALEGGNPMLCITKCDAIERDYPDAAEAIEEAKALAAQARTAIEGAAEDDRYHQLRVKIDEAMKGGNLVGVAALLEEMKERFDNYEPPPGVTAPGEVMKSKGDELKLKNTEFLMLKRVFDNHVGQDARELALAKFQEIEKDFPQHPFVRTAEDILREKGWLEPQ